MEDLTRSPAALAGCEDGFAPLPRDRGTGYQGTGVVTALGAWGFLPVVGPVFAFVAMRLGVVAFPSSPAARALAKADGSSGATADRAVAGVVLAFAAVVLGVRLLAFAHAVVPGALLGALVATALLLAVTTRAPRFAYASGHPDRARGGVSALLGVTALSLSLAVFAARVLPVWQWDSLGYHLPFVHFTLAARGVDGVPSELEYIGSYPHDVELFFVALRACLPDDRLVDLGQVPFGVGGAIVVAAIARRGGASRETAGAAGCAWLLVPAVFLQLPTDYVDVATATFFLAAVYFVLAPPSSTTLLLSGLALGLFVGSKPSAPLPGGVLFALLLARAQRAGLYRAAGLAFVLLVVFGGESYVGNVLRHANPVWPVRFDLGPVHLPGLHPMRELLAAGAAAPHLTGPLPYRMARSFLTLTSPPTFDMRVGGFGVVFLAALPVALVELAGRGRARPDAEGAPRSGIGAWVAFTAALLSPDPAVARYVLGFVGLVFAFAAPGLMRLAAPRRNAVWLGVAVASAGGVLYAAPGLHGEGPPLSSYVRMTDDERALAVGADGRPLAVAGARSRVGQGEAFAFDENMDLCDLAWDERQSYRVVLLPPSLGAAAIAETLDHDRVRIMAVGDAAPAGLWARAHPETFERLSALPSCRKDSCSLYARR